jgi:hypothetical protein
MKIILDEYLFVDYAEMRYIREVKIPRFRFTGTGDIHVPVPVNRGITCNLRNQRCSGVRKPIREWINFRC